MKQINWHYQRPDLAEQYVKAVGLSPISRIALLGVRRIGKTAFLLKDLAPIAEKLEFLPVYLNMWDNKESPQEHIVLTLERYIGALKSKTSQSIRQLLSSEVKKLDINLGVIKASFDTSTSSVSKVSASEISQISEQIKEIVRLCDAADKRPLFIIDEVQHLNTSEAFLPIQSCLRTNFDTFDEICVIYAGSSRGGVAAMFNQKESELISNNKVVKREMPFYNSAILREFPTLDENSVGFFCSLLKEYFQLDYSVEALQSAFKELEYSPFWFRVLLTEVTTNRTDIESAMEIVRARIRIDGGLDQLLRDLKPLDKLVYVRMYEAQSKYSSEDLKFYSKHMGKEIRKSSVQSSVIRLKKKELLTEHEGGIFFEKAGLYKTLKGLMDC